jgi:hypothetical protein
MVRGGLKEGNARDLAICPNSPCCKADSFGQVTMGGAELKGFYAAEGVIGELKVGDSLVPIGVSGQSEDRTFVGSAGQPKAVIQIS